MKRVENHVGGGDVLQELAVLRAGTKRIFDASAPSRELEAPAQLRDPRPHELRQHELGFRVALEDGLIDAAKSRMELEEILRAVVEVLAFGRPSCRATRAAPRAPAGGSAA